MQQKSAKREYEAGFISSATVIRSPINGNPSDGYDYEIMFHDRAGDMYYRLTKQRGGVRTFSQLSSAENVILKIGMWSYQVLTLEYRSDLKSIKKHTEFGLEEMFSTN